MTKFPLVSIIIVNFNGQKVLRECLDSLKKVTKPQFEIILVDNGSNDGSLDLINSTKIKVIKNKTNLGFAPANNQGAKIAKGKYILLLNNDTKVSPNFLEKMISRMEEDSSIGAMQPKIFMMDNKELLDNCGSFLNTIGFTEHWGFAQKDREEFNKEREIFSAKGACLLTRRDIVDKIGLFDDSFHSYFEESDFCWRVWLAGWRVLYYPGTFIYHKVGFTSKKMSQIDINYFSLKNRLSAFYKNFEIQNLVKFLFPHIILLLGLGVYYTVKLQFQKAWMVFKALLQFLLSLGSLSSQRIKVQKLRVVRDSKVLPIIMHSTNLSHMFSHFLKVEANFK